MNSALNHDLATTILDDRIRAADRDRRAGAAEGAPEHDPYPSVTVRLSRPDDHDAIRRLAELEGRRLPPEPALVAEACGRVLAARSLSTRELVADPWRPTEELVELLDLRSLHLRGELERRSRLSRFRIMRLVRALAPSRS
jgi:hypothetical protein